MSKLFTRPLELWRPTSEPDGSGGVIEGFEQVGDVALMGKVDQPSAKDLRIASAQGSTLTHSIYFDGDVDVRRGDELRTPGGDVDARGKATDPATRVYAAHAMVQPSEPIYSKVFAEIRQTEAS